MAQGLFDEFMAPEIEPTEYIPHIDVIHYCMAISVPIVLEIYKKKTGLIGFRYQAWVAWRDAGSVARHHCWLVIEPESLITDSLEDAKHISVAHAASIGIMLKTHWVSPA